MTIKLGSWKLSALCMLIVAATLATPSIAMQGDTIADIVLGQPNFSDNFKNFTSGLGLYGPVAVAIDASVVPNRLYVSDSENNRILGYKDVATLINGGLADLVIGQPAFSSNGCNNAGPSAGSLCVPDGVAVDASGNLYVADYSNNRVLEYNTPFAGCGSFPCVGGPANRVFGQGGSSHTNTCNKSGVSASSLCGPFGVALDTHGNLYVSDSRNSRVLEYNTPLTNNTADQVFGQFGSFTSGGCNNGGVSASSLCEPYGVAVDAGGNVYIADYNDNRVLEYNTPLTTGTVAHRVIGQRGSFSTTNFSCCSASSLLEPAGLALDGSGNLYVADYGENRVLRYTTPLSPIASADLVIGQNTFSTEGTNLAVTDASSIPYPSSVAIDTSVVPNRLYVADTLNNRVLGWKDVTALYNDAPADLVIGQPDFVSSTCY